jgi:hypothetical protein
MLRASWKSLLARKLRLLMSGFAIVLGVAFVAGPDHLRPVDRRRSWSAPS